MYGTAIDVVDVCGNSTNSGVTIKNAELGIQVGGPPIPPHQRLTVDQLLSQAKAHSGELKKEDRKRVLAVVKEGRAATTDDATAQTLGMIRDIAVGVISSGICAFIAQVK